MAWDEPSDKEKDAATKEREAREERIKSWLDNPLTNLDAIWDGTYKRLRPTVGILEDGKALFYRGCVNGIHGISGGGKSWIAARLVLECIEKEEHVVYVDLEDSAETLLQRLADMGADPEQVRQFLHYVAPEVSFKEAQVMFLERMLDIKPTLIIIDSTGESLGLEGVDPNADQEVAAWTHQFPRRLARQPYKPCILLIDHVPKAMEEALMPIGSQRKQAALTGAAYSVRVVEGSRFSRDRSGYVRLVCGKDRHGWHVTGDDAAAFHVSPLRATMDDDGEFVLDSTIICTFTPPKVNDDDTLKKAILEYVRVNQPVSKTKVKNSVEGRATRILELVADLVEEGRLKVEEGARKAHMLSIAD